MAEEILIEVQNISKRFGSTVAVDDVSFSVRKGETLALLGTSGSGKTTTLKMLNGLIQPNAGKILVEGKAVNGGQPGRKGLDTGLGAIATEVTREGVWQDWELRRRMGFVIQKFGLFPHYSVSENIAVVPQLLGWERSKIAARVKELMEMLGLPHAEFGHRYPAALSGGQQQRVGIARALAADPPIILMDEPFGALDPVTRRQIRREFRELPALKNKTIVMVTHYVGEAFELGNQVGVMHAGRLEQLGTPLELLRSPATEFVARFLEGQGLELRLADLVKQGLLEPAPYQTSSAAQPAENPAADASAPLSLDPKTSIREAIVHLKGNPSSGGIASSLGTFRLDGERYLVSPQDLVNAYLVA